MNNYGIIDIGSNTIRFNAYKIQNSEAVKIISKKSVAGLVTYIENGKLSDKGIKKLLLVLKNQLNTLHYFEPIVIYAMATASLRNISNLEDVLDIVEKECGIKIDVISQDEEALLGLSGINYSLGITEGMTIDIGGGSTEIIKFKNLDDTKFLNLDEGCLSLYSKYVDKVLPDKKEIKRLNELVEGKLENYNRIKSESIVGIGGTVRAIGNIMNELFETQSNTEFSYDEFIEFYNLLCSQSEKAIKTVLQVVPERIHTITTGSIILKNIMDYFHTKNVAVCNTGLREGFLIKKLNLR